MNTHHIKNQIALVGLGGVGTTSLGNALVRRFGDSGITWRLIQASSLMRRMATEQNNPCTDADLHQLQGNLAASKDYGLDRMIDAETARLANEGNYIIIDGRCAALLMPEAYTVYLYADPITRVARVAPRENAKELRLALPDESYVPSMSDIAKVASMLETREARDDARYLALHGFNGIANQCVFDLVIDTTRMTPSAVEDIVMDGYSRAIMARGL